MEQLPRERTVHSAGSDFKETHRGAGAMGVQGEERQQFLHKASSSHQSACSPHAGADLV